MHPLSSITAHIASVKPRASRPISNCLARPIMHHALMYYGSCTEDSFHRLRRHIFVFSYNIEQLT